VTLALRPGELPTTDTKRTVVAGADDGAGAIGGWGAWATGAFAGRAGVAVGGAIAGLGGGVALSGAGVGVGGA
jgi:hypothetical protein